MPAKKKGYGCIKVRVTLKDVALSSAHEAESAGNVAAAREAESAGNVAAVMPPKASSRRDRKLAALAEASLEKSLRAKLLERNLKRRSAEILLEKENASRLANQNAVLRVELQSTKKVLREELDDVHRRLVATQQILFCE
jgi:hypothetical protein